MAAKKRSGSARKKKKKRTHARTAASNPPARKRSRKKRKHSHRRAMASNPRRSRKRRKSAHNPRRSRARRANPGRRIRRKRGHRRNPDVPMWAMAGIGAVLGLVSFTVVSAGSFALTQRTDPTLATLVRNRRLMAGAFALGGVALAFVSPILGAGLATGGLAVLAGTEASLALGKLIDAPAATPSTPAANTVTAAPQTTKGVFGSGHQSFNGVYGDGAQRFSGVYADGSQHFAGLTGSSYLGGT